MLSRFQMIVIVLWVGFPIGLFFALNIINPGYMYYINYPIGPLSGFWWMIVLQTVNLIILLWNFRSLNRPDTENRTRRIIVLSLFTLIVFTVPSVWFVVLFPSFAQLAQ